MVTPVLVFALFAIASAIASAEVSNPLLARPDGVKNSSPPTMNQPRAAL